MFDHGTIRCLDRAESEGSYDVVLPAPGLEIILDPDGPNVELVNHNR